MDQRVDNERRPESERRDSAPRQATPGFAAGVDKRSWRARFGRRRGFIYLLAIGGAIATILMVAWWLNARHYESTDDAFIDTRTVPISAQVAAAIVDVPVTDNQLVDAGASWSASTIATMSRNAIRRPRKSTRRERASTI
jgi:hypothetical protein